MLGKSFQRHLGGISKLVLIFSLWVSGSVSAATRTVQYSGMGVNDPLTAEVGNWSFMTFCNVAIANLSSTDQRIKKVEFLSYKFKNSGFTTLKATDNLEVLTSGFAAWNGRRESNASSFCVGPNTTLAPGEVCIIRYPMETLTWGGKVGACMGKITVEDVDSAKPGSLVASGALYMNQEAMVLGGQLSGAYYASQTHVQSSDFGSTKSLRELPSNPPSGYTFSQAQNMNVFCGWACKAFNGAAWSEEECDKHCGLSSSGDDGGWTHHISGWTQKTPSDSYKAGLADVESEAETQTVSPTYTGSPADTVAGNADRLDQLKVELSDLSTQVKSLDRMQLHSLANTHFAGGMVYEMQIGAFNAICSAHNQYATDGGLEFMHSDGVDSHAVYSSNTGYPTAPPERLLCAHRHLKPDLFMRVGSTSPIVVNGGMPF